jgi:SPP1 gp7 family putative phage head morphogenesis protein
VEESTPDYSAYCMLALHPSPDLAERLVVPGGLPASELHVTLAYTGKSADVDVEALKLAATILTKRGPIVGSISGHARFTGDPDGDVIVLLVDSPDLEDLRQEAVAQLAVTGVEASRSHGYTPHLSLLYVQPDEPSPIARFDTIPVTFDAISVVHGTERTDFPFTQDPIVPLAVEAYSYGWAASGGPMTERVKDGCGRAIAYAIEHQDDADVFEVTLKIGSLHGMWAKVFERREGLISRFVQAVTELWRQLTGTLDCGQLIARIIASLPEGGGNDVKAAILGSVQQWLGGISDSVEYFKLRALIADGLRSGAAEGQASALAVAAEQAATTATIGFDFEIAFTDAFAALRHIDWPADAWIQQIVQGNGADIARALADQWEAGASHEELLKALSDLTDSADIRAVRTLLDQAISRAANQGAVNLYRSEGISQYDILTASDARVCQICQGFEDNNPHSANEQVPIPSHPFCRCAVAAAEPLNPSSYQPYLTGGGS